MAHFSKSLLCQKRFKRILNTYLFAVSGLIKLFEMEFKFDPFFLDFLSSNTDCSVFQSVLLLQLSSICFSENNRVTIHVPPQDAPQQTPSATNYIFPHERKTMPSIFTLALSTLLVICLEGTRSKY